MANKRHFSFSGCIVNPFGVVVSHNFKSETWAVSPNKARSNLCFQAKRLLGMDVHGYSIAGTLQEVENGDSWEVRAGSASLIGHIKHIVTSDVLVRLSSGEIRKVRVNWTHTTEDEEDRNVEIALDRAFPHLSIEAWKFANE